MKLDGVIFAIEQRTVGGCIDLAIVFFREHLRGILRLLAWFAIPSIALTWWLVAEAEWTLPFCLCLFFFECPFFGAALVASAGPRVFGDRFSATAGLRSLLKRLPAFGSLMCVVRTITLLGAFVFMFPAYLIAARYGFLAEILLLEQCPVRKCETRLSDLMNGTYLNLVGRLVAVMTFFTATVVSLFVLVDLASTTLFALPILFGRITDGEYIEEELSMLLAHDPRVAVTLVTILWLVYPVTRLAWFFCYLDVRIRKEAWDLELDFRVEAGRLEAAK